MKKISITLFLVLGICFLASNCIDRDDERGGGGSSDGATINVDSFSIYLSATDDESTVSFDTILQGDTLPIDRLSFHSQIIRDIYLTELRKERKKYFAGAAYAEPGPQPDRSGVSDIQISCEGDIHTKDSILKAGTNLSPLCKFKRHSESNTWRVHEDFFRSLGGAGALRDFTVKIPVRLKKSIDQKITFTIIHINGDSVKAVSPRVVAR